MSALRTRGCTIALATMMLAGVSTPSAVGGEELRVCADPNNLPFSNDREEGFENKVAELVARELGKSVSYTWWAQRRGFIRNTLDAGLCDVIMGVPRLEMIDTTRPYYRSSYVFVSRADRELDIHSIQDPRLRDLRIGVHLIGDDGANTPPAHALGEQGIVDNVVGYMIYGDYRQEAPPSRLIKDVETGALDIAAAWGPLARYFAMHAAVPMEVAPITETEPYLPYIFQYPIGMGVRKDDEVLQDHLNEVILEKRPEIQEILKEYGIPSAE